MVYESETDTEQETPLYVIRGIRDLVRWKRKTAAMEKLNRSTKPEKQGTCSNTSAVFHTPEKQASISVPATPQSNRSTPRKSAEHAINSMRVLFDSSEEDLFDDSEQDSDYQP